jgi:hypothetical protein
MIVLTFHQSSEMIPPLSSKKRGATMRLLWRVLVLGLITTVTAVPASAQEGSLSSILDTVFSDVLLQPPPADSGFQSHAAHFLPSQSGERAPAVFGQALTTQLSSVPVGTSGGAFTYKYDSSLGTFSRSTDTFGPSLAERAMTLGRGKASFGFSYQQSTYQKFEGKKLDDGTISFFLSHEDCCNNAFFQGDLIQEQITLDLKTRTFTISGFYGITDRLDVGVLIPVNSVDLTASVDARVLRLATGETGNTSGIHLFQGGIPMHTSTESGSASGLGDILIRSKYRFIETGGGGIAGGVDVRLPTGDEEDLLGLGAPQVRIMGIVSGTAGRFAPHANFGFTASGDSTVGLYEVSANELSYAFGTEFAPSNRLTFSVDFLGRSLLDVDRFEETNVQHAFRSAAGIPGTFSYEEFTPVTGNLNIGSGAFGVKANPFRRLVVSFDLVVPFTDSGLRPGVTPIVGLDYSF